MFYTINEQWESCSTTALRCVPWREAAAGSETAEVARATSSGTKETLLCLRVCVCRLDSQLTALHVCKSNRQLPFFIPKKITCHLNEQLTNVLAGGGSHRKILFTLYFLFKSHFYRKEKWKELINIFTLHEKLFFLYP